MNRSFYIATAAVFAVFANIMATAAQRALELPGTLPGLPAALAFGALMVAAVGASLSLCITALNR